MKIAEKVITHGKINLQPYNARAHSLRRARALEMPPRIPYGSWSSLKMNVSAVEAVAIWLLKRGPSAEFPAPDSVGLSWSQLVVCHTLPFNYTTAHPPLYAGIALCPKVSVPYLLHNNLNTVDLILTCQRTVYIMLSNDTY